MLIGALGFFAVAALLGMYLLSLVLREKKASKYVAITHGLFAATGLILLIIYPFFYEPAPILSLALLAGAAMGGLLFLYKNLAGQPLPKWLALGHGSVALIGIVTLVVFIII